MDRLEVWSEGFERSSEIFFRYHLISRSRLEYNLGDDVETTKALTELHQLLKTEPLAKTFLMTDFGALERYVLAHLQSLDEQIMLLAC